MQNQAELMDPMRNSKMGYAIDDAMIFLAREYLQEIFDLENGLEALKTELALRRDFTLGGAFNLFSRSL